MPVREKKTEREREKERDREKVGKAERHEISTELRVITRNTSVLLEVWRGNDSVLSQPLGPHVLPCGGTTGFPHFVLLPRIVGAHARATKLGGEGSRFTLGWGTREERDNTLSAAWTPRE